MATECSSDIASYLAGLALRIGACSPDDDVRSKVRQHVLDGLASAFIGCRSEVFRSLLSLCLDGKEGCGAPAAGRGRISLPDVGMLWTYAVNGSVYEDGCKEGACHPAAVVIPAVMTFAEGKSWDLIDRAIIAGYDVLVRLARGGNPELTRKGFHPTAITAPFGAAATASVLLGYDFEKTKSSLCIAALGCSGVMAAFRCGPTQPLQVAWGVRNGIVAALMAGRGHESFPGIIEDGFYHAYLGHEPDPAVDQPLQYGYAIMGSYLKPYPGCRHLHPSIDAFAGMIENGRISPSDIRSIRVGTYRTAVETEIHEVKTRGDAYFNIPYALAARAILGSCNYDAFDESHFRNEEIGRFMEKVVVEVDPEIDRLYPKQRGAVVEVHTKDGVVLTERVGSPLGEPDNPLSLSATRDKFRNTARHFLSETSMRAVESILDLSRLSEPADEVIRIVSDGVLR